MRINPTFGAVNQVVTFAWIPRGRFFHCVQLCAVTFAATKRFQPAALVFAVAWLGFFIASIRDPQYVTLFWRSLWRCPVLDPLRASVGDRKRIQNG